MHRRAVVPRMGDDASGGGRMLPGGKRSLSKARALGEKVHGGNKPRERRQACRSLPRPELGSRVVRSQ